MFEITDVKIRMVEDSNDDPRLLAFCSIVLDGVFVIKDIKIIDGYRGVFMVMPSRKIMDRCRRCKSRNCLQSRFCSSCGVRQPEGRDNCRECSGKGGYFGHEEEGSGREELWYQCDFCQGSGLSMLYIDICHPISSPCRKMVQDAVLGKYYSEVDAEERDNSIAKT